MAANQNIRRRLGRFSLSILVLMHLAAVVLPPLSFQSRGPLGGSPFVTNLIRPFEAYCQFLYLDRGYSFFAPDPGPSHLIQIRVEDSSGASEELFYPDLKRQWPRLRYHRHFMLTEYLHEIYRPSVLEQEGVSTEVFNQHKVERKRYIAVRDSYLRHLQVANGGKRVSMRRVEHLLPRYDLYVEDPKPLDHIDSYRPLLERSQGVSSSDQADASSNTMESKQ